MVTQMRKLTILFLPAIFSFCAWINASNEIHLKKTLYLDDSTLETKNTFFNFPLCVVSDKDLNFYILDNNRIMKFSAEGNVVWEKNTLGSGPGEYCNIQDLSIDDTTGTLFICDQNLMKIMAYSCAGNFLHEFKIRMGPPPFHIAADSKDSLYVIFIGPAPKNYSLHRFDQKGNLTSSFVPIRFKDKDLELQAWKNMLNFCIDHNGCIVVAYSYYNLIQKIHPNGKVLKEWKLPLNYKPKGVKRVILNPNQIQFKGDIVSQDIAVDNANNIYVLWGGPHSSEGVRIDVFDTNGKYLTGFYSGIPAEKEYNLQKFHIDNKNNLYILNPLEEPSLTRYSMQWMKKP